MPLGDITVHSARIVSTVQGDPDTWIEGEPDEKRVLSASFDCFYMQGHGAATERTPVGGRKLEDPTIIYETERDDGTRVSLKNEDEVIVDPEDDDDLWDVLGGAGQTVPVNGEEIPGVLFQVEGDPAAYQPPGEVLGYEATLKRVLD
jgi:hypothetical protein